MGPVGLLQMHKSCKKLIPKSIQNWWSGSSFSGGLILEPLNGGSWRSLASNRVLGSVWGGACAILQAKMAQFGSQEGSKLDQNGTKTDTEID